MRAGSLSFVMPAAAHDCAQSGFLQIRFDRKVAILLEPQPRCTGSCSGPSNNPCTAARVALFQQAVLQSSAAFETVFAWAEATCRKHALQQSRTIDNTPIGHVTRDIQFPNCLHSILPSQSDMLSLVYAKPAPVQPPPSTSASASSSASSSICTASSSSSCESILQSLQVVDLHAAQLVELQAAILPFALVIRCQGGSHTSMLRNTNRARKAMAGKRENTRSALELLKAKVRLAGSHC